MRVRSSVRADSDLRDPRAAHLEPKGSSGSAETTTRDTDRAMNLRWEDAYRHEERKLRVHGRSTTSTHEFRRYVQTRVREQVRRSSSREQLRDYVTELSSTGFIVAALASLPDDAFVLRNWEIGEVLAEVLLEDTEEARFPWPPSWDKRSASASLPGPDLIGFHGTAGAECFLFGEAKSSDADDPRDTVIYGDDGLSGQIELLLASAKRRQLLISWLCVRAKGQDWQPVFDRCLDAYLGAPSQCVIVGVLVSGSDPNERDLQPVRTKVETMASPYRVLLLGYYLPVQIADLPAVLEGTAERP